MQNFFELNAFIKFAQNKYDDILIVSLVRQARHSQK